MSVLVLLNEITSCDILSKWIKIKQLARVDAAFCNAKLRPRLLRLFESGNVTTSKDTAGDNAHLKWICERGITLEELRVDVDYMEYYNRYATTKKMNFRKVNCLKFVRHEHSTFFDAVINNCQRLRALHFFHIERCDDLMAGSLSDDIMTQVEEIKIAYCKPEVNRCLLDVLSQVCSSLRIISIYHTAERANPQSDEVFLDMLLVKNSNTLESLLFHSDYLTMSNDTVKLLTHCPQLKDVDINKTHSVDTLTVSQLLTNRCGELNRVSIVSPYASLCYEQDDTRDHKQISIMDSNMGRKEYLQQDLLVLFSAVGVNGNVSVSGLREITLALGSSLDDELMHTILQNNANTLTKLSLQFSGVKFTVHGFRAIFRQCANLAHLSLQFFNHIIGADFVELFKQPLPLTELELSDHATLETSDVQMVLLLCPNLTKVVIINCPRVQLPILRLSVLALNGDKTEILDSKRSSEVACW